MSVMSSTEWREILFFPSRPEGDWSEVSHIRTTGLDLKSTRESNIDRGKTGGEEMGKFHFRKKFVNWPEGKLVSHK